MSNRDARLDAYIEEARDFARPILVHLRALVHEAVPEAEETIKWSMPNFTADGSILCSMAAFKEHCAFNFWKAGRLSDPEGILKPTGSEGMGQLGRITRLEDLPPDAVLKAYLREMAELNRQPSAPPPKRAPKPPAEVPPDLAAALERDDAARATFEAFSPSHRREYIEWISEAKTEPTRKKRLATTLAWLAEGRSRNWKYEAGSR